MTVRTVTVAVVHSIKRPLNDVTYLIPVSSLNVNELCALGGLLNKEMSILVFKSYICLY